MLFSLVISCWVIGHFVWTLQKAENKIKVALDSGKVDQMTEVIGSSKTERKMYWLQLRKVTARTLVL